MRFRNFLCSLVALLAVSRDHAVSLVGCLFHGSAFRLALETSLQYFVVSRYELGGRNSQSLLSLMSLNVFMTSIDPLASDAAVSWR